MRMITYSFTLALPNAIIELYAQNMLDKPDSYQEPHAVQGNIQEKNAT